MLGASPGDFCARAEWIQAEARRLASYSGEKSTALKARLYIKGERQKTGASGKYAHACAENNAKRRLWRETKRDPSAALGMTAKQRQRRSSWDDPRGNSRLGITAKSESGNK